MMTTMNKLDLQQFADVMNTTTSPSSMSIEMKTYYDTELLENARPQMYFYQFAKKQRLPKNHGRTIEWRKFNTLPNASVLTEGVIPDGTAIGVTNITDSLTQLGMYVKISDLLEIHSIDPVILETQTELSASMAKSKDEAIRNDLMTGTNVQYANGKTARAGLAATDVLTPTEVNKAATALKKMNTPKINGKYVAIVHPSVTFDIRQSPEWIDVHKYAATTEIFNGEIGELHGVRFVETTQAKIVQGGSGVVVFCTLFFGKDAFGTVDAEGGAAEMIVKNRNEGGGPLNQYSTIGYKFETNGAVILYQERMIRVESGSTYSGVDKVN